ncbi:MAG TPA: DUF5666 domain-containing protein [Anaerolineales bacterium]|nr:DUF5666 domain-containing protein [Anaerolineales bacterium]
MRNIHRFKVLSFFLVFAYLLAACGGTLSQASTTAKGPKVQANVVAFTGIVEAMNGTEWTIGGQKMTLDPQAALDPNIAVGDEVKVKASVIPGGAVVALKIESSASSPGASAISGLSGAPSPDVSNASDAAAPQVAVANENVVSGMVEAIQGDTITVSGVTYNLAAFTEFKDALTVGDQVKIHVTVNADGTFTVREIEKSAASFDSHTNLSSSNDGMNHDANDDKSNHSSAGNGPMHHSHKDNSGNGSHHGSGGG